MPKINADWTDEFFEIKDRDNGVAESTAGWSCEIHFRSSPTATPANLILSTGAGSLLVGQPTPSGADNGVQVNMLKAAMIAANPATGQFVGTLMRTDGGRWEPICDVIAQFEVSPTQEGLP